MSSFGIGQLARQAGVAVDTVRDYGRHALPSPASRLASGYRRHGPDELQRLRFIRRAKALGFPLADIRELLSLGERNDIARVKRAAERKQADIERRIAGLVHLRDRLAARVSDCPGRGRADACPILDALAAGAPA